MRGCYFYQYIQHSFNISLTVCLLCVELCSLSFICWNLPWILPIEPLQELPHEKSMLCTHLYCKESSELPLNSMRFSDLYIVKEKTSFGLS